MERYTSALLREAFAQKKLLTDSIRTVYIGGGTPSLLPADLMTRLLSEMDTLLDFSDVTEFTSEANPGMITETWLHAAYQTGVNRISFGVQAAQPHLLHTLGRIHLFEDAVSAVDSARKAGFQNINVDLIFGVPGQSMDDWKKTIEAALSLSPTHISTYGLIVEEGTPLERDLQKGLLTLPPPDLERDMYDTALLMLSRAGFRQYEISNFALPGYECLHNIGYWDQIPYLGLGLSSASMIRCTSQESFFSYRWTNPADFPGYYHLVNHPEKSGLSREPVSRKEARFETVMLSLRMTSGINRARYQELHGDVPEHWYGDILLRLQNQGLLEQKDNCWRLTRRGMDIQNSILLEFME